MEIGGDGSQSVFVDIRQLTNLPAQSRAVVTPPQTAQLVLLCPNFLARQHRFDHPRHRQRRSNLCIVLLYVPVTQGPRGTATIERMRRDDLR